MRWAVRAALVLGVAASVAANVLHAAANPISRTISAWPPLALLITIELISRVPVHRRVLGVLRWVATSAIAGIAAWVSYWHMVGVASRYGELGTAPYLIPISVDGLVMVASVCLMELGGRIRAAQTPSDVNESSVADGSDEDDETRDAGHNSDATEPATDPGEPRPLDSDEWARVLAAVREYRANHPERRPGVAHVRKAARLAANRVTLSLVEAAVTELDSTAVTGAVESSTTELGDAVIVAPPSTRINGATPSLLEV